MKSVKMTVKEARMLYSLLRDEITYAIADRDEYGNASAYTSEDIKELQDLAEKIKAAGEY